MDGRKLRFLSDLVFHSCGMENLKRGRARVVLGTASGHQQGVGRTVALAQCVTVRAKVGVMYAVDRVTGRGVTDVLG